MPDRRKLMPVVIPSTPRRPITDSRGFVRERHPDSATGFASLGGEAGLRAYLAVDGRAEAIVEYGDRLRPGVDPVPADLRSLGTRRILLLSGDRAALRSLL